MERNTFDLIIIGAGINGAGIARDAAMRGLSVLIFDKGDISAARAVGQLVLFTAVSVTWNTESSASCANRYTNAKRY